MELLAVSGCSEGSGESRDPANLLGKKILLCRLGGPWFGGGRVAPSIRFSRPGQRHAER